MTQLSHKRLSAAAPKIRFVAVILACMGLAFFLRGYVTVFDGKPVSELEAEQIANVHLKASRDLWKARSRRYEHAARVLRRELRRARQELQAEGTVPQGTPRAIGKRLAAKRGWVGNEWTSLDVLWTHESGWDPNSVNPSSGACGIPQFVPCRWSPLPEAAVQIEAGLNYIRDREGYGRPSRALAHWRAFNWY